MLRLVLLSLFACIVLGCHAPGVSSFDPFGFARQTRVPPPPTNAVGNPGGYTAPGVAPPNAGSSHWPASSYTDPQFGAASEIAAADTGARLSGVPARLSPASYSEVVENDKLPWRSPGRYDSTAPELPRLLPSPGNVASIPPGPTVPSQPPRVRGFSGVSSPDVRIVTDQGALGASGVRQARWQARYDDDPR